MCSLEGHLAVRSLEGCWAVRSLEVHQAVCSLQGRRTVRSLCGMVWPCAVPVECCLFRAKAAVKLHYGTWVTIAGNTPCVLVLINVR